MVVGLRALLSHFLMELVEGKHPQLLEAACSVFATWGSVAKDANPIYGRNSKLTDTWTLGYTNNSIKSRGGPQPSNIGITLGLAGNAQFLFPPKTYCIRICIF